MKSNSILILAAAVVLISAPSRLRAYSDNFPSFGSAFGLAASTKYSNTANAGAVFSGNSTSLNYRAYSGILPSVVRAIDFSIGFFDESPSAGELQSSTAITAKITVQITGGNTISQVKYRISNSGTDDAAFNAWQSDAVIDSVITAGAKERWKIALPNASGQGFVSGGDNYIQWRAYNNAGDYAQSGMYRVLLSSNATGVTITQPDARSEYTSLEPYIKASIGGLVPTLVQIKIDDAAGTNLLTLNNTGTPSIYDAASQVVSCKYAGPALTPDAVYTLTVSASNNSGQSASSSLNFIPKGGAIADLIPYPSPFDPKIQPAIIRYVLDRRSDVWINIYDMSGRAVKCVIEAQSRGPGVCEDEWNGDNFGGEQLANGVYFCEIVAKSDQGEFRRYSSLAIYGR